MRYRYKFLRLSLKWYFKIFHQHTVVGKENIIAGPAIIACNHVSYLDPPVIIISLDEEVHFLAREKLFSFLILRTIMKNFNTYPVTEGPLTTNLASFKVVAKLLKEGSKIVVFPEGARCSDGKLQTIKQGVALLALRNEVPIIPMYIHGIYNVWNRHQKLPRLWGKTCCMFGKPIHPHDYANMTKKQAQEMMTNQLDVSLHILENTPNPAKTAAS